MPVSLVEVWGAVSMLVHRTVVPWYTVRVAGENAKFWMVTSVVKGGHMDVGEAVGVRDGVAAVAVPQLLRAKRRPQELRVPLSIAALSLTVSTHLPLALWPSNPESGKSGR